MKPLFEEYPGKTCALVLEDGGGALTLRAWLTEQSQQTIDVQHSIFAADNVGSLQLLLYYKQHNEG